jgi:predicted SprT family Zn-dependent metalloprotease
MNTTEAKNLAITLMAKHGVYAMGYSFAFNNRKRSAGICSYRRKTIELSKPITQHSEVKDVIDTILHEIAHALVGSGHGHDSVWQRKAIEIGANGKRCYDDTSSHTIAYNTIAKYKGVCIGGHDHFRNKLSRKRQSCSVCSPRFNEKYLITWELNK